MTSALCVFAKDPVPGRVKTRLAPVLGAESAALLARAFLLDTLDRLHPFPGDLWLAYSPAGATEAFQELLLECDAAPFLTPQPEGDLGDRLEGVLCRLRERGYQRVLLLGADSPTLPWASLMALHDGLVENDFTLGPADDGGFWGLGARGSGPSADWQSGLLDGVPWSGPDTLAETKRHLEAGGSLGLAPAWYDVDEPGDLLRLRADPTLPYCPRTNRLVLSERVARFL
jgi:rSAM/selenodomain-associated transferase 1